MRSRTEFCGDTTDSTCGESGGFYSPLCAMNDERQEETGKRGAAHRRRELQAHVILESRARNVLKLVRKVPAVPAEANSPIRKDVTSHAWFARASCRGQRAILGGGAAAGVQRLRCRAPFEPSARLRVGPVAVEHRPGLQAAVDGPGIIEPNVHRQHALRRFAHEHTRRAASRVLYSERREHAGSARARHLPACERACTGAHMRVCVRRRTRHESRADHEGLLPREHLLRAGAERKRERLCARAEADRQKRRGVSPSAAGEASGRPRDSKASPSAGEARWRCANAYATPCTGFRSRAHHARSSRARGA